MKEFQTGAVRDTGGKGRMDLLPWSALIRISKHMEDAILPDPETGKPHYPERNWEQGLPIHCMVDSAFRHLAKYVEGWDDEDHLCAAATNLLMAMWLEENKPLMQDIPSRRHFLDPSLASDRAWVSTQPLSNGGQEKYQEEAPTARPCAHYDNGRCRGTKEMDECSCSGDKRRCDRG